MSQKIGRKADIARQTGFLAEPDPTPKAYTQNAVLQNSVNGLFPPNHVDYWEDIGAGVKRRLVRYTWKDEVTAEYRMIADGTTYQATNTISGLQLIALGVDAEKTWLEFSDSRALRMLMDMYEKTVFGD
jgi:hypothetical protein